LKRKFKKVDGHVDIKLEITDRLGASLDEAHALYMQMVNRHEMSLETMTKEFFAKISENMPGETKYFLWRIDGKLVAFSFCLVSKDYFLDYYLGLDYSMAYDYHLYFVRFRDMMKWCLANGMKTYEMGCTNYDPKKRLDFKFVPLDIYVKFTQPWANRFVKIACEMIKPQNYDPVLKKMVEKNPKQAGRLTLGVFCLILVNEAIDAVAQILMKKGLPTLRIDALNIPAAFSTATQAASNPYLWTGILIYTSNFFIWIFVLARLDLSMAVPLTSINYIILPILAMIFLHEKISFLRWLGISLIVLGIYLISKASSKTEESALP